MDGPPVPYMERTRRYYEAQGFERAYAWARFDDVPFMPLPVPLAAATLAIVTTSALYDRVAADPRYVASASLLTPPPLFANDLAWDRNATHMEDRGSYFPVEPLRELVVVLPQLFHAQPDQIVDNHRVRVPVASHSVGLPLQVLARGPLKRIHRAGINVEMVQIADVSIEIGILRGPETQPGRHSHDVADSYRPSGVAFRLPFRYWGGLPQIVHPLLNQDPHQRARETFPH